MNSLLKKSLIVLLLICAFAAVAWIIAILLRGTLAGNSFRDAIGDLSENSADNVECRTSGGEKYGDTKDIRGDYTIERKYFYSKSLSKCLSETTVSFLGSLDRNTIVDVDTGEVLVVYDKTCVDASCLTLDGYKTKKAELE
ncbi:MAG: hypothetical protein PHV43_00660 [Candidatus Colwellbacteria bacterium]|nr:hypothetical protein [Candidatus Colwellbacteria bacterium]